MAFHLFCEREAGKYQLHECRRVERVSCRQKGKYNLDGNSDKKLTLNCLDIDHSTPTTKLPSLKYTRLDPVDERPRGEISAGISSDWLGRVKYGPVCTWTGSIASDGLGGLGEMKKGSDVMNGWISEILHPSLEQPAGHTVMSSGERVLWWQDSHLPSA